MTVGKQFEVFEEISAASKLEFVINSIKLCISCLIHGLVHEETDSLYFSFDELDISRKNLGKINLMKCFISNLKLLIQSLDLLSLERYLSRGQLYYRYVLWKSLCQ
jgi:hypothetical protein